MGHLKIIVDHVKLEYKGPLVLNDMFRMIETFVWEEGYDKQHEKDFELNNPAGKSFEWQVSPWKKISDYSQYILKIRILGYDFVKSDIMVNGKKSKVDTGRVIVVIDAFLQNDYDNYWDEHPVLYFLRTIYDHFIFKVYTENLEHRLVHDMNMLADDISKFFNMYRHYTVVLKTYP